jgi:hypothetical protein
VLNCGRVRVRAFAVRAHAYCEVNRKLNYAVESSTHETSRFDLLGLGQAMCDFSGAVAPDFLVSKNLSPGGRRYANRVVRKPHFFDESLLSCQVGAGISVDGDWFVLDYPVPQPQASVFE